MIDKAESVKFFDDVAKDWKRMAYNTDKPASIFPSSQLRQEIVVNEIKKNVKKDAKILDIGCANGSLVIELIKNGYTSVKGIDSSPKMIEEAKLQLKNAGYNLKNVFEIEDIETLVAGEKFDVIIAMGLIEYLDDISWFFNNMYFLLRDEGKAYIESKNKLFNLFSANDYTLDSDIKKLMGELDKIEHLSPKKLEDVAVETYVNIGNSLKEVDLKETNVVYRKYPFKLPQYSPIELKVNIDNHLLHMEKIIYYHFHPFPPRYRKNFPALYDALGVMMQPLGYTPVGALMCSAYVMVIKK